MDIDDVIALLGMHCNNFSDEVIIVIGQKEYKLEGTVIGDMDEQAVYVYAEEK